MSLPNYKDILIGLLIMEKVNAPKQHYYDFCQGLKCALENELDYHSLNDANKTAAAQAELLKSILGEPDGTD